MLKKIIAIVALSTFVMSSSSFISPIIAAPINQKNQSSGIIEKKVQSSTPLIFSNSTRGNIKKELPTKNSSSKNMQNATLKNQNNNINTASTSTATLDLILKSIQLSQGEEGSELWRLNAKAAQMEQQKESFIVESPQLTYTMKPNNTKLYISSNKGIINQKEQVLQFKENVLINFMDSTLKSKTLVYNGTQKIMVFPEGGSFLGKNIKGTAGVILWHLDTLKVEAKNSVSITFSSKVPLN